MKSTHSTPRESLSSTGRRSLPPFALLVGLLAFTPLALLPAAAHASCKEGFCTGGADQGDSHVVTFTTTWTNVSHFNVGSDYGQFEIGGNERQFSVRRPAGLTGAVIHYSLQACSGGGFMQTSKCTPWAYFTHTMQ
jgi:hypothetical protein